MMEKKKETTTKKLHIVPLGANLNRLVTLKYNLQMQLFRKPSWNEVLTHIFTQLDQLSQHEKTIRSLKKELGVEVTDGKNFAQTIALNLSTRPFSLQANTQMSHQTAFVPPPPSRTALPKPIGKISSKVNSVELKQLYKKEIKQIFTGSALKPSEVNELNELNMKWIHGEKLLPEDFVAPSVRENPDPEFYNVEVIQI